MDSSINNTSRPPYGIISILMIGAFVAFLNSTLLNVALPSIMDDLQVKTATVQWLSTGYMLISIFAAIFSLVWFVWRQAKLKEPMLNFGVYNYSMFTLSSAITMIVNMALFSGFLLLPIYVQNIRGISPMDAGLMLLPGALLNALMSPLTGKMFDKYGGRILAVVGLAITISASFLFGQLTFETSYLYLVIVHAIRMLGMSLVMMPVSTNGLNQLPKRLYPHGTAMNNTLNMISGAIGTALLVTLMAIRSATTEAKMIAEIGAPTKEMQLQIEMQAMLEGINFTFIVSAIILTGALILAFFIKRATESDDTRKDTPPEPRSQKIPKLANN